MTEEAQKQDVFLYLHQAVGYVYSSAFGFYKHMHMCLHADVCSYILVLLIEFDFEFLDGLAAASALHQSQHAHPAVAAGFRGSAAGRLARRAHAAAPRPVCRRGAGTLRQGVPLQLQVHASR